MADRLRFYDPVAEALEVSNLDAYANRLPEPKPAEDPARRVAGNMMAIPAAWALAGLKKTVGLPEAAKEAAVDTGRALGNVGRTNPDSDPQAVEDAMKLAGLVGGPQTAFAMAGPRSAEVAGIFGGLRAATKDLDALKYAKEMEAATWDAPGIWRETGWGRDKSGNWMFEIDDSGMKLVPIRPGSDQYRIEHPEFEKAYPGMLATINQEIYARPLQSSTRGYWDAGNRKLVATDPDPDLLRETVLHELNHAAQSVEGFARGTSPQSAEVAAVRQRIPKEEIETARNRAYETLGEFEDIFRKNFDAQGGPKWDEVDPRTKQRFRDEHFKQWPGDQPEYDRAFDTVSNGPLSPYSLHNIYRREAGEVASRNTEARADFPAELRRKWDPWSTQDVPDIDQYVLPSRQHFSWSDDGTPNPGGAAPGVSASMVYKPGDKLAPAGSGYVSVPGKPSTVDIPGVGTVEARPIGAIEDAASSYMRGAGRPGEHRIEAFSPFSEDRARKIAEAFEAMRHNPGDPATRRSYEAMIDETLAQYKSLKDAGIDFRFMKEGDTDPYARSPSQGYKDMVENGRLTVFPTDFGFGTNAAFDPKDNPLLKRVGRVGDKDDAVANDAFRAVHDAYGHFGPGNPFFRHKGEERAWEAHSKMYSPEAVPAMSTETRGQNSWLNFGPHAEHNKTALGADTIFADQKIGLLPMWAYATGKPGFAEGGAIGDPIADALAVPAIDDVRALEQYAGERAAEETAARARERRAAAYPAVIPALIPPMAVVNAAKGARELVGAIGRLGREEPTVEDALTIAGAATTGGLAAGARPRPGVVSMSGAAERPAVTLRADDEGSGPAIARGLTGEDVLAEAAKGGKKLSFTDWRRENEHRIGKLLDLEDAKPAIEGRPDLPRFDPPRGPSARIKDAIANPEVEKGLVAAYERGKEIMPQSWYRTGPLFDVFKQEWGDQAPKAYENFMQMLSATSPRSRVPDNIRTGSYYNYLTANNMPIPDKPAPGYGSVAQNLHRQNVEAVLSGGMDPLKNPKPASFVENLLGNETPVTIDTHNFRLAGMLSEDPRFLETSVQELVKHPDGTESWNYLKPKHMLDAGEIKVADALERPGFWAAAPNPNEYKAYEDFQRGLAREVGATPAEWQEKLWVGGGDKTGLGSPPEPVLRTLDARVLYTADRLGEKPETILRKMVRGEIPLLSIMGAGAAAGALAAMPDAAGAAPEPAPADDYIAEQALAARRLSRAAGGRM